MRKHYLFFEEGSQIRQIICAILINLPVISYGTAIGWMSPMTLLLQSENTPTGIPLSDTVVSWMASAPFLLITPFSFICAFVADRWGRKTVLLAMSVCLGICWTLLICSMSNIAFILSRCVVGVSAAPGYVVCPLYTKEISEDRNRGALVSLVIVSQTLGNLLAYILGDVLAYHQVLYFCLSLPVLHLVLFVFMPESPSFLLKKGKEEQAIKSMAWLRCRQPGDPQVKAEIDCLKKEQSIDDENVNKFALNAICKDKILTKAFIIAMVVTIAREVCGAHPVLTFAGSIFSMASGGDGSLLSPNQQSIMLGAVQVCGALLAVTIVEKLGRKPLLIISSLISGLSMCCLATWFLLRTFGVVGPSWIPITTLCLCIFCDASGLQPISIVVMNELFSFKYRGTVSSITMSSTSLADFFQLLLFKPVANTLGVHVEFFFFGAVCLSHALFVFLYVPETKRKSVEEIYEELEHKMCRKKSCTNSDVTLHRKEKS